LSGHPFCGRKGSEIRNKTRQKRNVLTPSDRKDVIERQTALTGRDLATYDVDIAALSETRFHDEGHIEKVAAGYSIYWKAKPATETHQSDIKLTRVMRGATMWSDH